MSFSRNVLKWIIVSTFLLLVILGIVIISILNICSHESQFNGETTLSNKEMSIYDFKNTKYRCYGSCYCEKYEDDDDEKRRAIQGGSIRNPGKMVYFLSAISSLVAYSVAKDHFIGECEGMFDEQGEEFQCLNVKSEVDSCDTVSDSDEEYSISQSDEDGFKRQKKVWTIFGASRPRAGSQEWEDAETLGEFLAKKGYIVRNGGYTGTMEAASIGASKVEGGEIEGCVCSTIFKDREQPMGNPHITKTIDHNTLLTRIQTLTDSDVSGYIILPGSIGTFTELCVLLNLKCVDVVPQEVPVIVFQHPHQKILNALKQQNLVSDEDLRSFTVVNSMEECLKVIEELDI